MNNSAFGKICNHQRLKRINDNFVRCLSCGQSMISQKNMSVNKKSVDFCNENKSFLRNFDRNFSNVLDEVDEENTKPIYEYYTDRLVINKIKINRSPVFQSYPEKYEVYINGSKNYLTNDMIAKMLSDINAIRIDENQYQFLFKKN